ncbi:MAG: NifB/NifX family molybdenum-iron cluster-binding protein [Elusimicrobiales bacterium]
MKICIPTETRDGLKARVYGHFGSAPYFTLCDSETRRCEIIDNGDRQHVHGMCDPLKAVGNAKPDAVIAGGIGMGAIRGLNAAGIKVYISREDTVETAVEAVKSGKLREADAASACGHHGGHGCQH